MPEFLTLLPPDAARQILIEAVTALPINVEMVSLLAAQGRVSAVDIKAPHALPLFPRSTVDGYAVKARDTFGASDSLPGYLEILGEVPMGAAPGFTVTEGNCAIIHTGGMLPDGADAVLMLEYTQVSRPGQIEIQRSVAIGENTITIGEDVAEGQVVVHMGQTIRPAEIGGLAALGILQLGVIKRPVVAIISSGDEVIEPGGNPVMGQVRDINSYSLAALVNAHGGEAVMVGIVPDNFEALLQAAKAALAMADMVLITAGSSASTRDMTANVIDALGEPGVLVHGINTRPGKPTILGAVGGKPVIGLPGNPVSALVNGYLFVLPLLAKLLSKPAQANQPTIKAVLSLNLPSQAGREDWQPVRLIHNPNGLIAEPIFGKSNLIFTLAAADGLIRIHPDANGISAGELVDVYPID